MIDDLVKVAAISQVPLVFGGLLLVWWQLKRMKRDCDNQNTANIVARVAEHNWNVLAETKYRDAVESLEGLDLAGCDKNIYWGFRALHLGHLNLVWQAWELAGRPRRGIHHHFDGWQRFAENVVVKHLASAGSSLRKVKKGDPEYARFAAAHDLWEGLHRYEVLPLGFVRWLTSLAEKQSSNGLTVEEGEVTAPQPSA